MAQQTDVEGKAVFQFTNNNGDNIQVAGEVVDRDSGRHDWCEDRVTIESESGKEFTLHMGDTKKGRKVYTNGSYVGFWYALIE